MPTSVRPTAKLGPNLEGALADARSQLVSPSRRAAITDVVRRAIEDELDSLDFDSESSPI